MEQTLRHRQTFKKRLHQPITGVVVLSKPPSLLRRLWLQWKKSR